MFSFFGFAVLGGIIGGAFFQLPGLVFGIAAGLLLRWCRTLSHRITALEKRIETFKGPETDSQDRAETPGRADSAPDTHAVPSSWDQPRKQTQASSDTPPFRQPDSGQSFSGASSIRMDVFRQFFKAAGDFFTRGNTVVRIGLVVLFFGVAFFIKYAAERGLMPIELRLAALALAGVIMLIFGWRLRDKRAAYALLIQGGAVGMLYLTIFGAAQLYHLIPLWPAFALMFAMVVLSALLALLQNSAAMAIFGAIGGFLAPVLISTDTGSHVALFSYYAIINTGIVGIAWFTSWRALNWIGFVFTFGIGLSWGFRFYRPEYFLTTEPFLILFFLFYLAISILFAHRQPVHLKGYIDGSLVFGLPVAAFGLQSALVNEYTYGMAVSAIAMGSLYITLAYVLWQRRIKGMRLLTESFLCLGVVFASIAIPLGLESDWTTALWCLEGAGLVWIGARQHRVLARVAGLLLQAGAGAAFLETWGASTGGLPVLNSTYMSCLLISLSGFISGYCCLRHKDTLQPRERQISHALLIWALVWWFFGGLQQIFFHLGYTDNVFGAVLFIAGSSWAFGEISERIQWPELGYPAMGMVPVTAAIALLLFNDRPIHPFAGWGAAAWSFVVVAGFRLLYRFDQKWPDTVLRGLHTILLVFIIFILTWEFTWAIEHLAGGTGAWAFAGWGLFPALAVVFLYRFGTHISWPVMQYETQYLGEGLMPVILFVTGWIVAACFKEADPKPLAYLPVVNPVELVQVFAFTTLIKWRMELKHRPSAGIISGLPPGTPAWVMLAAGFLWINSVIARAVHFFASVDFNGPALFASVYFQSALSIVWTLTALVLMAAAARRKNRPFWVIGAVLLGVVVAKLFLIDLAGTGTVARIVSFTAVGILMLVIGYVSPLPPKKIEDTA